MKIEGFFLVLLLVLFQGCSDVKQSKEYVKVVSDRDSLAEMLEKREKEVEEFAKEFDQIEQNLTAIDTNKARLILINSRGKTSQKERIHNLIADIYIALDKNQTLIKGLEKRAMFSNETTALKSIVKTLRNTLEAKATEIQILEKQLSNLELEVKNLKDAISFKENQIAQKDTLLAKAGKKLRLQEVQIAEKEKELNKVYFIRGTSKELEKAGVLKREGGVAGFGVVKTLGEKMGTEKLKVLNARSDKLLLIGRYKKKKIVTSHPSDSYFFIANDGQFFIKISYPEKFWSISKYLVVVVE
jgi:chromosome segregation ATPase